MEGQREKAGIARDISFHISEEALTRFKSFCDRILGIRIDEVPTAQSIFMKQNFSILFYAAILFLLTNGFYLVKKIVMKTMITIDMIPLYYDGRRLPCDADLYRCL